MSPVKSPNGLSKTGSFFYQTNDRKEESSLLKVPLEQRFSGSCTKARTTKKSTLRESDFSDDPTSQNLESVPSFSDHNSSVPKPIRVTKNKSWNRTSLNLPKRRVLGFTNSSKNHGLQAYQDECKLPLFLEI